MDSSTSAAEALAMLSATAAAAAAVVSSTDSPVDLAPAPASSSQPTPHTSPPPARSSTSSPSLPAGPTSGTDGSKAATAASPSITAPVPVHGMSSAKVDEDEGVIRCICSIDDDDGFTIQCERCFVWQHCACFGMSSNSVPEEWLCELCDPRPVDVKYAVEHQLKRREAEARKLLSKRHLVAAATAARDAGLVHSDAVGKGKGRKPSHPIDLSNTGFAVPELPTSTGARDAKSRRKSSVAKPARRFTGSASNGPDPPAGVVASTRLLTTPTPRSERTEDPMDEVLEALERTEAWNVEFTPISKNVVVDRSILGAMTVCMLEWEDRAEARRAKASGMNFWATRDHISPSTGKAMESEPTGKAGNGRASPASSVRSDATKRASPSSGLDAYGLTVTGNECWPIELEGPSLTELAAKTVVKQIPDTSAMLSTTTFPSVATPGATVSHGHRLPATRVYPRPATYGLFAAEHSIPAGSFIAEYKGELLDANKYRADPINQYRRLGASKPHTHIFPPPLNMAIDARRFGAESRFARFGCHPNAVLRPILFTRTGRGNAFSTHDAVSSKVQTPQPGSGPGSPAATIFASESEHDASVDTSARGTSPPELLFGIFALRDIPRREEIVLGWEWDDGHVVHFLLDLLENPLLQSNRDVGGDRSEHGSSDTHHSGDLKSSRFGLIDPSSDRPYRGLPFSTAMSAVCSTLLGLCLCACEKKQHCAVAQMHRVAQGSPMYNVFMPGSGRGGRRPKRPELGPLVGAKRGWTRAAVRVDERRSSEEEVLGQPEPIPDDEGLLDDEMASASESGSDSSSEASQSERSEDEEDRHSPNSHGLPQAAKSDADEAAPIASAGESIKSPAEMKVATEVSTCVAGVDDGLVPEMTTADRLRGRGDDFDAGRSSVHTAPQAEEEGDSDASTLTAPLTHFSGEEESDSERNDMARPLTKSPTKANKKRTKVVRRIIDSDEDKSESEEDEEPVRRRGRQTGLTRRGRSALRAPESPSPPAEHSFDEDTIAVDISPSRKRRRSVVGETNGRANKIARLGAEETDEVRVLAVVKKKGNFAEAKSSGRGVSQGKAETSQAVEPSSPLSSVPSPECHGEKDDEEGSDVASRASSLSPVSSTEEHQPPAAKNTTSKPQQGASLLLKGQKTPPQQQTLARTSKADSSRPSSSGGKDELAQEKTPNARKENEWNNVKMETDEAQLGVPTGSGSAEARRETRKEPTPPPPPKPEPRARLSLADYKKRLAERRSSTTSETPMTPLTPALSFVSQLATMPTPEMTEEPPKMSASGTPTPADTPVTQEGHLSAHTSKADPASEVPSESRSTAPPSTDYFPVVTFGTSDTLTIARSPSPEAPALRAPAPGTKELPPSAPETSTVPVRMPRSPTDIPHSQPTPSSNFAAPTDFRSATQDAHLPTSSIAPIDVRPVARRESVHKVEAAAINPPRGPAGLSSVYTSTSMSTSTQSSLSPPPRRSPPSTPARAPLPPQSAVRPPVGKPVGDPLEKDLPPHLAPLPGPPSQPSHGRGHGGSGFGRGGFATVGRSGPSGFAPLGSSGGRGIGSGGSDRGGSPSPASTGAGGGGSSGLGSTTAGPAPGAGGFGSFNPPRAPRALQNPANTGFRPGFSPRGGLGGGFRGRPPLGGGRGGSVGASGGPPGGLRRASGDAGASGGAISGGSAGTGGPSISDFAGVPKGPANMGRDPRDVGSGGSDRLSAPPPPGRGGGWMGRSGRGEWMRGRGGWGRR